MVRHNVDIIICGVYGRDVFFEIIQKVFKQMSYPYVMFYTCKEALFTLSVISHAQNLNRNNADTCEVKYINN